MQAADNNWEWETAPTETTPGYFTPGASAHVKPTPMTHPTRLAVAFTMVKENAALYRSKMTLLHNFFRYTSLHNLHKL